MSLNVNIKPKVRDISFANIFWRKFSIRLATLLLVSILLFTIGQRITIAIVQNHVDNLLTSASLELAQLSDANIAEDKMVTMANITLSTTQDNINAIGFVKDSSLSMYNLNKRTLIAQSFEIPIVDSDDLINWWKGQTNIEMGLPIIHLNNSMKSFCEQHANDDIYMQNVYCINSLLFPSELIAKDNRGKELDSIKETAPSISTQYPNVVPIKLDIVGNKTGDTIYGLMHDFKFQKIDSVGERGLTVEYDSEILGNNVTLWTNDFVINDSTYRVDCGYQLSFWSGAWQCIILFEIVSVCICAVMAFLNTKETLLVYR
jgi:hypothetical protein